jgi:N-acetylglucosamine kinase-like BadF-type ATPase
LAKVLDEVGEVSQSLEYFKKALISIKNNPPQSHNRPGVVADFAGYVATEQYKFGDKSAIKLINQAIKDLKNSGEDKISDYNYKVWLSGIHMRTAELLKDEDLKLSKEHLALAKEIIESDERLTIRMKQWERLSARLMQQPLITKRLRTRADQKTLHRRTM